MKVTEFYPDDMRQQVINEFSNPETKLMGMSEQTGLRILDALYLQERALLKIEESQQRLLEIISHSLGTKSLSVSSGGQVLSQQKSEENSTDLHAE